MKKEIENFNVTVKQLKYLHDIIDDLKKQLKKSNDELKLEDSIEITIKNVKLVVKHNDIGYSIDTYIKMPLDDVLIRDEQVCFDDLEEVIINDVKQVK